MKINETLVKKVQDGDACIEHTKLQKDRPLLDHLLSFCFPKDEEVTAGGMKYYYGDSDGVWIGSIYVPSGMTAIPLRDFFVEEVAALSYIPVQEGKGKTIWPDDVRIKMIEKSELYDHPQIYQYGYYDGYQRAQSTPSQEVDAGKLFDGNADCDADNSDGTTEPAMSREKFIEVFDKFRKPDVGQLEKIIGDAFDAGMNRCAGAYDKVNNSPNKEQYITEIKNKISCK